MLLHKLGDVTRSKAGQSDEKTMASALRQSLVDNAAFSCIEAAQKLITLLCRVSKLNQEALPAPWITVFCKFLGNITESRSLIASIQICILQLWHCLLAFYADFLLSTSTT